MKEQASLNFKDLFGKFLIALCLGVCVLSLLVIYVFCVDRVAEFMVAWEYKNKWVPFQGSVFEYVMQLPEALLICFKHFPEASFASLLFLPLLIFLVPLYDVFVFQDLTILLTGFLPLCVGAGLFTGVALMYENT